LTLPDIVLFPLCAQTTTEKLRSITIAAAILGMPTSPSAELKIVRTATGLGASSANGSTGLYFIFRKAIVVPSSKDIGLKTPCREKGNQTKPEAGSRCRS
jgi:hypothetical protein